MGHEQRLDPFSMAVMANRLDAIVRQMANTVLRAAFSVQLSNARDSSCAIITADHQLLASAEGLPVHIYGAHLQAASMCNLHPDLAEGDAYLHNDPYLGNTHAADHTVLVPVFVDGEHLFTACAKAHLSDVGNSIPTTYHYAAKDVYEEGALIFPCVRVQRDYRSIDDVIRLCRTRIRVPDVWTGDFLALLGGARIGERRLKEFCTRYGTPLIKAFVAHWLDYSERRMIQSIRRLPRARLVNKGIHDPIEPFRPTGTPINVVLEIDPDDALISVDLRDNIDCIDCGLNLSEAATMAHAGIGIFNCLEPDIPHNAGSFRRIRFLFREGCVVGKPKFPHSCSVATDHIGCLLVNLIQSAFAQLGDGYGLAQGAHGVPAGFATISGRDPRRHDSPYIHQLNASVNGGPGSPRADGWVNYFVPVVAGLSYRDSVEINELKLPIEFKSLRLLAGSAGAGRFRGGPAAEVVYGPRRGRMTAVVPCDGQFTVPRGARGGLDGIPAATYVLRADGREERQPNFARLELEPGELIRAVDNSGGGYGSPLERDPERVLRDVLEGWETVDRARQVYGVVLRGSVERGDLEIEKVATDLRRRGLVS